MLGNLTTEFLVHIYIPKFCIVYINVKMVRIFVVVFSCPVGIE